MEYVLGNRRVVVIREMTKLHEEILRGDISDILDEMEERTIAGEYVIVVEGRLLEERPSDVEALLEVIALIKKGLGRKEAVKRVAESYGLSKKELYDKSLKESEK
jgi:16S rRNA (cytidine1402-2'-O)-methyltransferase